MEQETYDVIIVGAGLAGLSCAYELAAKKQRVLVLEAHDYPGGRTASFVDQGMPVESGLHRVIGYYSALPELLARCQIPIETIVTWEHEIEIRVKDEHRKMVLGIAPRYAPKKMIRSLFANRDCLSLHDKLSVIPFFVHGLWDYAFSDRLDRFSVEEYAAKHRISKRAMQLLIEPLSSGLFFLPPGRYSAYVFFGMLAPALTKWYKMRIGAFMGGMSEVMCQPIVNKIRSLGGTFRFGQPVQEVITDRGRVIGVKAEHGTSYYAKHIVIATTLPAAKKILAPLGDRPELSKLFHLPSMSAVTLQLELSRPALPRDITTFGPHTDAVSFAEQSRTTFSDCDGRLSVILGHAEQYVNMDTNTLTERLLEQLKSLDVHLSGTIQRVRKVAEQHDFYALDPGNQALRPRQKTGIEGLLLAGDYTLTSSFATMEGAVLSGKQAAKHCLE